MTIFLPEEKTQWSIMWIAFGGGIVAATHLGKLPPALPEIMTELGSGLVTGGWIASMISFTGFALGLIAGTVGDRFGQRRVLISGLVVIAVGSLLGAFANSGEVMLVSRFIEGIGYSATTVAGAGMVTHVTAEGDRKWSLGIWSSYVPVGFAGMLIGGALILSVTDWRTLWLFSSGLTFAWAGVVFFVTTGWRRRGGGIGGEKLMRNITACLKQPGALLVAACFALYAAQHISIMAWLPTYMREEYNARPLFAATVPAIVLFFNAVGGWASAWAMSRDMKSWLLLVVGAIGMGLTQLGVFSTVLSDEARLVCALIFGICGGMIPAAALGSVAVYTPTPAQIGTMNGLMVMGTNAGMLFGPPAVAAVRATSGNWNDVIWLVASLAAVGAILGLVSQPLERRAGE
ncbi:MAG: MFS transporter [Pseudomonadota bacterium]|nr:MFS transporter [Pseudomonadota bacterium]